MKKNKDLLITIFGGWFGLHYFCNKKYKKGLIYLFTCGLFFVGWWHDIYKEYKAIKVREAYYNQKQKRISEIEEIINNTATLKYNVSEKNITYDVINGKKVVKDYIVLDFETTGLHSSHDKIIEFTFLKYINNVLVDEYSSLVNPECHIPTKITDLTGITNEMIKNEKPIKDDIINILKFIDGFTLIGHNICSFDFNFLKQAIEDNTILNNNIEFNCIDTLIMAQELLPDLDNHRLATLKGYLKIECGSHRSKEDCEVTAKLYKYLTK